MLFFIDLVMIQWMSSHIRLTLCPGTSCYYYFYYNHFYYYGVPNDPHVGVHNPHQNVIGLFPANTWWTPSDGIMMETGGGGIIEIWPKTAKWIPNFELLWEPWF